MHDTPFELAGNIVTVRIEDEDHEYHVEDYWDRVSGGSWMDAVGNPAALIYAARSAAARLPLNDEVLYGKIGGLGVLVHVDEIVGAS